MQSIPEGIELVSHAKDLLTRIDYKFALVDTPRSVPATGTPGMLLDAMTQARPNVKKQIDAIWDDTVDEIRKIEKSLQEVDDHAVFQARCLDHIQHGLEIGKELDSEMASAARTLRRSYLANIFSDQEMTDLLCKCRTDLRKQMEVLQEKSTWLKKYRRTAKLGLMKNTRAIVDRCVDGGTAMSRSEKSELKSWAHRILSREDLFNGLYREMYFKKKKGKAPAGSGYRFKSLKLLSEPKVFENGGKLL